MMWLQRLERIHLLILFSRHLKKKLTITFERSFKPDEMGPINQMIERPLQNDSIFYDGMFLLRCGLSSTKPFSEKYSFVCITLVIELYVLYV